MLRACLLFCALIASPFVTAKSPSIALEKCFVKGVKSRALCATHDVAEDPTKPLSEQNKISLNVVVLPKFKEESTEHPVMFLAGGPGQAATELAGMLNHHLYEVRQKHDVILVDQRGTGKSSPLNCETTEQDFDYLTSNDDDTDMKSEVIACLKSHQGKHLPSYSTYQAIDDFEAVRVGLGHNKVHLYGGSYGTRSGFAYLKRYPESVASAILDSTAPMQLVIGFFGKTAERAFDFLLEDCQAHEGCNAAFPELKQDYLSLLSRLDKQPIVTKIDHPISGQPVEVYLSKRKVVEAVRTTLYNLSSRQITPYLIHKAANGDIRSLVSLVSQLGETDSPGGLYMGLTMNIVCNEDLPRATTQDFAKDKDNYFSGELGYSNFTSVCEYWPQWQAPADFSTPLKTDVPVLLFSGKYDPVTPPSYGDMALETLNNAKHIVLPYGSHVASLRQCPKLLSQFFATTSVAELDLSCVDKPKPMMFFTSANKLN